jgi:V-type H+-transporting ATPase subunit H
VSKGLVEVVKSAQKEKVVRVGLLSLRNLLGEPELGAASDMVEAGLPKVLATRGLQVSEAHEACRKSQVWGSGK